VRVVENIEADAGGDEDMTFLQEIERELVVVEVRQGLAANTDEAVKGTFRE
jgi:hypothetical protein